MKTRAIFLGTFNPPHSGHRNCLSSVISSGLMQRLNIDKIHIIPCWQNPNKDEFDNQELRFWQRYKMCIKEFAGLNEFCVVDDIEEKIKPQYTYQLFNYFKSGKEDIIGKDFWWIITAETFNELLANKWRNSDELLHNNKFILVQAPGTSIFIPKDIIESCEIRYATLNTGKYVDAHSIDIRKMIKENNTVIPYIKPETLSYIIENKLYY